MYGMVKTTLYLPPELKRRVEQVAHSEGRSEADVIREVLSEGLQRRARPLPTFGFVNSGDPDWAATADQDIDGFGE